MRTIFSKVFIFFILFCICCDFSVGHPQPNAQRAGSADYTVTHLDIRDAILSLVSVLRDQMDKLERHEVRERQLGEQLTRSLSTLEKRSRGEEKNLENIAQYIVRLDEKIKFIQTTVEKQSEERKVEQEATMLELQALKQNKFSGGSGGGGGMADKLNSLDEKIRLLQSSTNTNSEKLDGLTQQIKTSVAEAAAMAVSSLGSSSNGSAGHHHELSDSLMSELNEIKEALGRTAELESQLLATKMTSQGENDWQGELTESMDSQRKQLAQLEEEISKAIGLLSDMTTSAGTLQTVISQLETDTKEGFKSLDTSLRGNGSEDLDTKLNKMQQVLKAGQQHLEDKVKETESAIETLFTKMETGYSQLSRELKGLSNVESVLLDTGDSVLDTKRRLEYGVQQIMGELNHQLQAHTSKLNESLQQRFDGLATAVLGNQSIALTNLTSRMEEEISQVWRQIGILYHQMSRSANLLDEIHSQTSKYVNNSLDTMTSMDGKVGAITYRMGEVDDNLNYLLGRMSLVVQEFNMIKGGLGDALQSLKNSFVEIAEVEKKPSILSAEEEDKEGEQQQGTENNEIVGIQQQHPTPNNNENSHNNDQPPAETESG